MSRAASTDYLVHAVSMTAHNPVLEGIRDGGAEVVLGIYRLVKTGFVHALENQAVGTSVRGLGATLRNFADIVGGAVVITYVQDTLFVCGQLLRASRGTYEAAMELGAILLRAGVSELAFEATVSDEAILAFCAALTQAVRDPNRRGALLEGNLSGITVRKVDPGLDSALDSRSQPVAEQIVRIYATALVVMRRFFDDLAAGSNALPHRVKRLAQRLVTLFETGSPVLLAMTALASSHRDEAGRSVQTAILALASAWGITHDRAHLARLAMEALLSEVGRVRLAGEGKRDRLVTLGDSVEQRVPAESAGICLRMAGVSYANAQRTVAVYEAGRLERQELVGPLYEAGWSPLLESRILELVRGLVALLVPRDASRPRSLVDALTVLSRRASLDPVVFRLLVRAVGLVPVGTVVELAGGEWAVVLGGSSGETAFPPKVRVVTDASGNALGAPKDLDLARPGAPRIRRIIEPERARFNVVRPLLD